MSEFADLPDLTVWEARAEVARLRRLLEGLVKACWFTHVEGMRAWKEADEALREDVR